MVFTPPVSLSLACLAGAGTPVASYDLGPLEEPLQKISEIYFSTKRKTHLQEAVWPRGVMAPGPVLGKGGARGSGSALQLVPWALAEPSTTAAR